MTPVIDFLIIDQTDPRVLIIDDNSIWGSIEDEASAIEITLPGSSKPKWFYFRKCERNIFNSLNLDIQCAPEGDSCWEYDNLPDGIYTIKLMGTPPEINKEKQYLRTSATRAELDGLWVGLDLTRGELGKAKADKLVEIDMLLTSAEANVRQGFNKDGVELFNKALKKIRSCG